MASKKVPPIHAQAVIEKCKLCDRGEDETFFCTNCNEEMCKHCKISHQRSKGTRNHKVISIAEDKDTSTSIAKINCTVHQKELVQMYCTNCKVLVCLTCIAGKHKNHAFDKLADVTDKYKYKISGRVNDIKQEIQEMKSNLQSMEGNKKDYIEDTDDAVDDINKKRKEWKSQADTIADGLIQQVQDYKNHDLQQIDKRCKQIQDLISEKENMLRSYEGINQSANLDTIIKCATNIQKDEKPNPVPIYASSPRFVTEGMVDLTEIFSYLKIDKENVPTSTSKQQDVNVMKKKSSKAADTSGKSSTIDNTVIAEFEPEERVQRVSVIGDNHAWMSDWGYSAKNVRLVDIDGDVIKDVQLDIGVYDIKATTQGEVFITEVNGLQIQKYNTDGKCVTIADMSPLITRGLCITSNNELLVCLRSDGDDDKVVRMTINGHVKQTIQYDQHKTTTV